MSEFSRLAVALCMADNECDEQSAVAFMQSHPGDAASYERMATAAYRWTDREDVK